MIRNPCSKSWFPKQEATHFKAKRQNGCYFLTAYFCIQVGQIATEPNVLNLLNTLLWRSVKVLTFCPLLNKGKWSNGLFKDNSIQCNGKKKSVLKMQQTVNLGQLWCGMQNGTDWIAAHMPLVCHDANKVKYTALKRACISVWTIYMVPTKANC